MPFVNIAWLPKSVRADPQVRRAVARAVINALVASPAEVDASKVVVRYVYCIFFFGFDFIDVIDVLCCLFLTCACEFLSHLCMYVV